MFPTDFTREVPARALPWLLQYGLPYSYWQKSIGYSPSSQRLVFLVGEPHAFSIGRYVGSNEEVVPKDPTVVYGIRDVERVQKPNTRKWYVWGDSHKQCIVVKPNGEYLTQEEASSLSDTTVPIVIVEDLISAHKVANAGATSVPLFGTILHPCHVKQLQQANADVILWLDQDQQMAVKKKALNLEGLINKPVKIISTKQDPKFLSINEINREVNK